jgi:hypothetical protein
MKISELFEGKFVEPFNKNGKPNPNHPSFEKNKAAYDAANKSEKVVKVKETSTEKAEKLNNALNACSTAFMVDGWGELDSTDLVTHKIIPALKKRIKATPDKFGDDFKDAVQKTGGEYGIYDALYKFFDKTVQKFEKCKNFNAYVDQTEKEYKELMDDQVRESFNGRADWDPNASGYQGDYGGEKNWGRKEREDDEHHHLDEPLTRPWYLRVDGQILPDSFPTKAAATAHGHGLLKQNPESKIFLTQTP